MGSSSKHWPSMFKKSTYQNSQHSINSSFLSRGGHGDERTPEPKPRWNPKPEQIQILEAIFNSGMMNPPREEIKKIREQLQEYGPIGEANVFYWFQNRKSRTKNKHKQKQIILNLAKRKNKNSTIPNSIISSQTITTLTPLNDGNQNLATDYFHTPIETNFQLPTPPFLSFPNQFSNMIQQLPQQNVDVPNLLNHEIFMNCANRIPMNDHYDQGNIQDHEAAMNIIMQQQQKLEDQQLINLGVTSNSLNDDSTLPPLPPIVNAPFTDPFSTTQFQGVGEADDFTEKCIVSIDNRIFKVDVGPFNICQIFGDQAVLVDSSGQTILTDERGITLDSLQHGASYYLITKRGKMSCNIGASNTIDPHPLEDGTPHSSNHTTGLRR